jgi:hypothetical protein
MTYLDCNGRTWDCKYSSESQEGLRVKKDQLHSANWKVTLLARTAKLTCKVDKLHLLYESGHNIFCGDNLTE